MSISAARLISSQTGLKSTHGSASAVTRDTLKPARAISPVSVKSLPSALVLRPRLGVWSKYSLPSLTRTSYTRSMSTETPNEQAAQNEVEPSLPEKEAIPFVPLAITAISVIPFLTCAVIPFAFPYEIAGKALFMQMTYGAVSLSMLGSVHWGLALANYKRVDGPVSAAVPTSAVASTSDQVLRYVGGALPGLAAWLFMTQDPLTGMVGLMGALGVLAAFEMGAHKARLLPAWYIRLRMPWNIAAILSLGLNLIHLL